VQREDWLPALEKSLFARYLTEVMQQTQQLLKSFFSLQALGSQQPKQQIKQLLPLMSQVMSGHQLSLRQGLWLLQTLDMRYQLAELTMPTLWLFADADAIVPSSLMAEIAQWQPQASCHLITASGHLPFLAQPSVTAEAIISFLQGKAHD
jgi:pimeloyl-[acyl-carrier protein] methyl ester esterase